MIHLPSSLSGKSDSKLWTCQNADLPDLIITSSLTLSWAPHHFADRLAGFDTSIHQQQPFVAWPGRFWHPTTPFVVTAVPVRICDIKASAGRTEIPSVCSLRTSTPHSNSCDSNIFHYDNIHQHHHNRTGNRFKGTQWLLVRYVYWSLPDFARFIR